MRLKHLLRNKMLFLFIILFIGATLRFYKLDFRSLWYDEAANISSAKYSYTLTELFQQRDMKTPAYMFLFLKVWMGHFGENEFSVRSLSVICGVLSIFFLYLLASKLFSEKVGLIASFLLSISPFHLYYSQENSQYSLLLLCTILSTLFFVKICKGAKRSAYIFYTIINILLCYTHMFGLYIVLIHNIYFLLFKKRFYLKREWLITQGLVLAFILPLLLFTFARGRQVNEIDWISRPGISVVIDTVKAITYGGEKIAHGGLGFEERKTRLLFARSLMFICGLLVIKGILSYRNSLNSKKYFIDNPFLRNQKIIFLVMWIAIPVSITFIFSLVVFPSYVARYLIIIIPAYLILLAIGVSSIKHTKFAFIVLTLILVLTLQALWVYFNPEESASWREIAAYVKKEISPEDMVIFVPLKQIIPFTYYFSDKPGRSLEIIDIKGKKINGKWKSVFREGDYAFAGVKLGDLSYEIRNNHLFKTSQCRANKIFLIASPYWPGIGQSVLVLRSYFLKNDWKEEDFFYPYPGVKLFVYKRKS